MRESTTPSPRGLSTLQHQPVYPSRPGDPVVEAFKKHVLDTGSPETFPTISTTAPPPTGALFVLHEFTADRRKRPRRDMAPCPICSPHDEQYLDGLLIWCEATAAIYAIGRKCGHTVWKDGRLDMEVRAHQAARAERKDEDYLLSYLPQVAVARAWLAEAAQSAKAIETAARTFRHKLPSLYKTLRNAQTAGGELTVSVIGSEFSEEMERLGRIGPAQRVVHQLRGGGVFLNPKLALERRMALADQRLAPYDVGSSIDQALEVAAHASTRWKTEARMVMQAEGRACYTFSGQIASAIEFFSEENFQGMQRWSQAQSFAQRYEFRRYADRASITGGRQEQWTGQLRDIVFPSFVPDLGGGG